MTASERAANLSDAITEYCGDCMRDDDDAGAMLIEHEVIMLACLLAALRAAHECGATRSELGTLIAQLGWDPER